MRGPAQGIGSSERALLAHQAESIHNEAEDLELQQAPPQAPPCQLPGPVLQPIQCSHHQQHVGDVGPHQELQIAPCTEHASLPLT